MIRVSIIMGSRSDWSIMAEAESMLKRFDVGCETLVVSAHRTPERLAEYAKGAAERGVQIIIAGAGGAAHLAGMVASHTVLPVLGVPIGLKDLSGIDSLLSIMQMPAGVPVGTLAIGESGAKNAALLAVQILALHDEELAKKITEFRESQTSSVPLSVHD